MTGRPLIAIAATLVTVLGATGGAHAADPAAFAGTVTITHTMTPLPGLRVVTDPGESRFEGTYRVRGGAFRGRFAPPRSYLLAGSGTEVLKVFRHDRLAEAERTIDHTFSAKSSGTVRLLRGARRARETSPLLLRLFPGGRFKLALTVLDSGQPGVDVDYAMVREDTQSCYPTGSTHRLATYEDGVLVDTALQDCPGLSPTPPVRRGTKAQATIWGANVWAPHIGAIHPDLCARRMGVLSVLSICGRRNGSRMRGRFALPRYEVVGVCAFEPWGPGGLPSPLDPIVQACSTFDIGVPAWRLQTAVSWDLRQTG